MKRFALITLFCLLASVLMCADVYPQAEAQDDKGVRQDSDNRWMTDGRHKRVPNANQIELYRRAAEQGFVEAQYNLGSMYDSGVGVWSSPGFMDTL